MSIHLAMIRNIKKPDCWTAVRFLVIEASLWSFTANLLPSVTGGDIIDVECAGNTLTGQPAGKAYPKAGDGNCVVIKPSALILKHIVKGDLPPIVVPEVMLHQQAEVVKWARWKSPVLGGKLLNTNLVSFGMCLVRYPRCDSNAQPTL